MMKWCLLATLIFTCQLQADRLQTNATADTYILDQRNVVSTAGSFTIGPANASLIDCAMMESATPWDNYGATVTARIGLISGTEWRWMLRFNTMDDSMRAYASGKSLVWDSARVKLNTNAAVTTSQSLVLAMAELKSGRAFGEGTQNSVIGLGSSWTNYDSTSGTKYLWTTPGAGSTSTDYHNDGAIGGWLDTSATLTSANTAAGTWLSFKIPGTSITDTINNSGLIFRYARVTDGTTTNLTWRSDDYTTDTTKRPQITVYFHEMEYPDFGGADTLLMKTTNPATQIAYPIMTFDISSIPAGATLDACSLFCYVNANYSDNAEGTITTEVGVAMKPIKIGTGTGTATATNKLHWASWSENGTADSAWTTAGALDVGYVCNTNSGSGDDKTANQAGSLTWSGTGWKGAKIDTAGVNAYWKNACRNFGVFIQPTATITDDAWYVLSSVEGANDPYLVIWYTPAATTPTKGTGRFGRAQNGAYLNVR